jgi:hypothetical protein
MRVWLRSSPMPLVCFWVGTRSRPSTRATPPPAVGPGVRPVDRGAAGPRSPRSDRSKSAARASSTIDVAGHRRIAVRLRTVGRIRTADRTRLGHPIRTGRPATSTIAMGRHGAARATTIATSHRGVDRKAARQGLVRARAAAVAHPAEAAASARAVRHRGVASTYLNAGGVPVSTAATASTTTPSMSSAPMPRGPNRNWPSFTSSEEK